MKTPSERLKTLLKVREAELESAVTKLLEKRSGLQAGLQNLKAVEMEKQQASEDIRECSDTEQFDPLVHGRFLARLRRETLRLNREISGLQEIVEVARTKVKSAYGQHGSVESLVLQRQEQDEAKKLKTEQQQLDGDSCQRFVAKEFRGEAS
ncbi:hypothetical protein CBD41_05515 [bacterium TMED181]|nr:hypothetical protein [Planctomycetota bacterium]OUW44510.1 MAG: hypothetical protein CBD41_05515 [bacterium TMED181]